MGPAGHIVVATDDGFGLPTAVTLRSLSVHSSSPVTVWVLAHLVRAETKRRVEASIEDGVTIEWVDLDATTVENVPDSGLGSASLFRLLVGEVLPATLQRVLYLDVDTLIEDDIRPLLHSELRATAAAVRSVHYPVVSTYGALDNWPHLGLDPRAAYFNSGVLLLNLDKWREAEIGHRALDHLRSPYSRGNLADQEALNVALAGRWEELDPRWNVQSPFLADNRSIHVWWSDDQIREARESPAIIHYLDRPKPWHRDATHPWKDRWRSVAAETAFAPVDLERTPWRSQARWRIRRAASALVKGR